jgi:tetratricopeptide (TPR) repeat protein
MTCPQCQAQNADDARFCEECGARLALACPQCGAEIRRAEAVDLRYSHVFAAWSAGYACVRRGNVTQAARVLEPALDRLRAGPVPIFISPVASMLGLAYALTGRHAEALPLLAEAVEERARSWTHSLPFACLGEGHLLAGRTAEAGQEATRVLELARTKGERGIEAWTLRLLGEVAAHSDPPDTREAERWYREASALAEELGMRPLVAHCHLGLGKLYRRTGPRAKAEEHLTTATTMYREMGMGFWLEKAATVMGRWCPA